MGTPYSPAPTNFLTYAAWQRLKQRHTRKFPSSRTKTHAHIAAQVEPGHVTPDKAYVQIVNRQSGFETESPSILRTSILSWERLGRKRMLQKLRKAEKRWGEGEKAIEGVQGGRGESWECTPYNLYAVRPDGRMRRWRRATGKRHPPHPQNCY